MRELIQVDVAGARAETVGDQHGVTASEWRAYAGHFENVHAILKEERSKGVYGFYDLYKDDATFAAVQDGAGRFLDRGLDNLVILGIGGSALGTTALATALLPPYYNALSNRQRGGMPRLFVMDNVDPRTFKQMLDICEPSKTLFNVISKSGGTAETSAQFLIVLDHLLGTVGAKHLRDHLVVTTGPGTEPKSNALQFALDEYALQGYTVPDHVGGRFSVFTPVGMFPAAMLGMDLDGLRAGCETMDRACASDALDDNPAAQGAAVHSALCLNKGKTISVMLPYADALRDVADWFRQLWAESLGKKYGLDGQTLHRGQTPVKALGATDQHSQLQLYLEGPNDKIINVLQVANFGVDLTIPDAVPEVTSLDYFRGKSLGDLLQAECHATAAVLEEAQRPVIRIDIPHVNANTVAQLLYLFEYQTAIAGRFFGVNAFDQPAVEAIKIKTREFLGNRHKAAARVH
ncbi:MAG: hypothetical protein WD873_07250 [Candidatus Hydrogenedentales bacterium]